MVSLSLIFFTAASMFLWQPVVLQPALFRRAIEAAMAKVVNRKELQLHSGLAHCLDSILRGTVQVRAQWLLPMFNPKHKQGQCKHRVF